MDEFLRAAIQEAELGFAESGIPIGSVVVHDGQILGRDLLLDLCRVHVEGEGIDSVVRWKIVPEQRTHSNQRCARPISIWPLATGPLDNESTDRCSLERWRAGSFDSLVRRTRSYAT